MAAQTLEDLLVETLRDTYNAEKQLVKALPKMAKTANSDELRAAFEEHLEVTRKQVTRLEKVFNELGVPVRGRRRSRSRFTYHGALEGVITNS